jgi:TPR repeat protein
MRSNSLIRGHIVALLCLSLALFSSAALASKPVFETPDQKELLRAAHSLKKGHQEDAARLFKRAAEWGNKDAQKTLGLMYVKGLGVNKDWAMGYAWLDLASSLGSEAIIATRNQIFASMSEEEKSRVKGYSEGLDESYGDRQALLCREEWVRKQKRQMTGSRTGNSGGVRVRVADATGKSSQVSGSQYFSLLEGSYIVEFRQAMGEVEIGELRLVDDDS